MTRPGNIPSQEGFEPGIFRSWGGRLNHQASEAAGSEEWWRILVPALCAMLDRIMMMMVVSSTSSIGSRCRSSSRRRKKRSEGSSRGRSADGGDSRDSSSSSNSSNSSSSSSCGKSDSYNIATSALLNPSDCCAYPYTRHFLYQLLSFWQSNLWYSGLSLLRQVPQASKYLCFANLWASSSSSVFPAKSLGFSFFFLWDFAYVTIFLIQL